MLCHYHEYTVNTLYRMDSFIFKAVYRLLRIETPKDLNFHKKTARLHSLRYTNQSQTDKGSKNS